MNIEDIERTAKANLNLVQDDQAPRLLQTAFNRMGDQQCRWLCGRANVATWPEFKERLLKFQAEMGICWEATTGRGGPLSLTAIDLPFAVGEALGQRLLEEGVRQGRLDEVIKRWMPETFKLMNFNRIRSDLGALREGLKAAVRENTSYRFAQGRGQGFSAATREYRFAGKRSRSAENQLGNALLPLLKKMFDFTEVEHIQTRRQGGRFENADFVGFNTRRGLADDEFVMYSFELKSTNDIPAISQAISQAVNYRTRANYTYIIIPLFDTAQFHDDARFSELLNMCRSNGIGALSVSIAPDDTGIADLVEVQQPRYYELADAEWLRTLVSKSAHELCPLCRRIVDEESRLHCGWKVGANGDEFCMKQRFEQSVMAKAESGE